MPQRYQTHHFFISITNAALSYNTKKRGRLAKHKTERPAESTIQLLLKTGKKINAQ